MLYDPAERRRGVLRLYYTPMSPSVEPDAASQAPVSVHYDTRPVALSFWRRLQVPLIAAAVYGAIRTLGPTLRFEVLGWPRAERVYASGHRAILTFWHQAILSATWWWRDRGIVVLNSTNFDGQWTRKVIEWFGFGTAQGSSTRGGLRGLAMMANRLEEGRDVALTVDGPRGPRFVAKPGPAMLARRTGFPILVFHIALERARTFEKTWDLFQLPYPFSRAVLVVGAPIYVAQDAGRDAVEEKHAEMQRELERVRETAEGWFTMSDAERERCRREFNA
jgi:lysophospholipid acyltransferase (LPLAT)-like uncharacterized protein